MSQIETVTDHLERLFDSQRLVFWRDPDGEYASDIEELDIPGVTTVKVANDEYALKHRILKEEPEKKFLVYRLGDVPVGIDNWLLDLELAYGVFTADRTAMLRNELRLNSPDVDDVLREHEKFFRATTRTNRLKALLEPGDDAVRLRAKMVAVLLGQEQHTLTEIMRTLLIENANDKTAKYDALVDHGLLEFHWNGVEKIYGYRADQPSMEDFVLWMFERAATGFTGDVPGQFRQMQIDFENLRNHRRSADALTTLAQRAAESLGYPDRIEDASLQDLLNNDLFEEVEQKIVSTLAHQVAARTISARDVSEVIRSRQSSVWVSNYQHLYDAIGAASELLSRVGAAEFTIESFDDGLEKYRSQWFQIDQLYRHFQLAARNADYQDVLEHLRTEVEKSYVNRFLTPLGDTWQKQVDQADRWLSDALTPQSEFFRAKVDPIVRKGNRKAVIIISDAMRYEVADELRERIRQEERFDASLDAMLGVLPSHTPLGMAALLPNKELVYSENGESVLVDQQRSDGIVNRNKILAPLDGLAILAEDVLGMTNAELKKLYTEHRIFYVYHDRIDSAGDNAGTEHQVFEATEKTLEELVRVVKKLTSANATNILVTADHGFLYQDEPLEDGDFLSTSPHGDDLVVTKRRYVLGRGLKEDPAFTTFEPDQVGLEGDLQVQIPKSIRRLRRKGPGSRFVHGGAALQEVVVPVLAINKGRKDDIRPVNVNIFPETDRITTGQLVVKLIQSEPVTDKVQERTLRAGIYAGDVLISNQQDLIFDQTSTDKRDWYQKAEMLLSKEADAFNDQMVEFRLEEKIKNTSKWRTYASANYLLRRSFTMDFDF